MKNWTAPEVAVLEISETAHNWTGIYRDGGYIGDGEISGHLSWSKPSDNGNNGGSTEPSEPTDEPAGNLS
ncbi:MAG: hypothetical protein MJ124_02625 [Lachnospiraceae bacterium]|nr:hypothetical protein [Lachnospiraceae bacterium]